MDHFRITGHRKVRAAGGGSCKVGCPELKIVRDYVTGKACRLSAGVRIMALPVLFVVVTLFAAALPAVADDRCDVARKEMMRKKEELSEYVDALGKSHAKDDYAFMDVLNFKINELIQRTKELEQELAGCPEPKPATPPQGMSGIKSDDDVIPEKNCGDLKKMLVPLMRKVNSLKRREKSVFSGLSPEEKSELAKAENELKMVKESMGKRCGAAETPGSLQKRLRR